MRPRILLAAFAGCVALFSTPGCSKAPGIQVCPARFAGRPLPIDYRELETPAFNVPATCATMGDTMKEPLGCYSFALHIAVIPTRASDPVLYRALQDHERCHAKGWGADHPA